MKKKLLLLFALILMLSGCENTINSMQFSSTSDNENLSAEKNNENRIVQDCYNYEVTIPAELKSISTNYQSAAQILLMLGGEDVVTGVPPKFIARPWVKHIYPEFCNTVYCPYDKNNEFNIEELLAQDPELFLSYNANDTDLVRNAGITTANIGLYDYPGIEVSILKIGEIMGDEYYRTALKWDEYYKENLTLVQERVADIPEDERIRVLFLRGDFERSYGTGSVVSSWINLAGGINVLDGLDTTESKVFASAEEILASDPDCIIIGDIVNYTDGYNTIISDERFANLAPIANNKIYFNPSGIHQWEKYSGESALQILWAAKTFYPEKFEDIDLIENVKYFYKTFHDYELTDEQAEFMIEGKTPEGIRI